jgi:hypothetical protein
MASRRNGKFKLRAVRPALPLAARGAVNHSIRAARWYVRLLAEDLYHLRLRFDLVASQGRVARTA